jgi:hypothetical protein
MDFKGKVKATLDVRSGAKKDGGQWSSQTVVLHIHDEKFPKDVAVDVSGDNCGKLNIGDEVEVKCDVSSREYQGKWFTTVRAWRVDVTSAAPVNDKDDLPF